MQRKIEFYELIIQTIYFILAFIAGVFVVKNILDVIPLYKSFSCDENSLYNLVLTTQFGDIYSSLTLIDIINAKVMLNVVVAFIKSTDWIVILFLIANIALLFLYFMFIKWEELEKYLRLSFYLFVCYLSKYLLFALSILIFFKDDIKSLSLALVIGTSIYTILSLIEFGIIAYIITKYIFNITNKLKLASIN